MRLTIAARLLQACLPGLFMIAAAPVVHADPIQPTYTITDLGDEPIPKFTTDASGNEVVIAANGQTGYQLGPILQGTFLTTPAGFPVPEAVPLGGGSSYPNLSVASNVTLFPNGTALALDQLAVNNGTEWQRSDLYYVQQGSNGSWGPPVVIAEGPTHDGPNIGQGSGVSYSMDKSGDVLISTQSAQAYGQATVTIYNVNTGNSTNLADLAGIANYGFSNLRVLSMDQDGRILVLANHQTSSGTPEGDDLLLLTPPGVSSDPIIRNAPEPSSWAVMAMALAAFAVHRGRERRGRKAASKWARPR